jgi:hypothetical protein
MRPRERSANVVPWAASRSAKRSFEKASLAYALSSREKTSSETSSGCTVRTGSSALIFLLSSLKALSRNAFCASQMAAVAFLPFFMR